MCGELGTAYVAFSLVARGFLCGAPIDVSVLAANDLRTSMPRFLGDNHVANLKAQTAYDAIVADVGCTSATMALAWLLHKAPQAIPIPGTTSVAHLQEDLVAADVQPGDDVTARLEATINTHTVKGQRYTAQASGEVDTKAL